MNVSSAPGSGGQRPVEVEKKMEATGAVAIAEVPEAAVQAARSIYTPLDQQALPTRKVEAQQQKEISRSDKKRWYEFCANGKCDDLKKELETLPPEKRSVFANMRFDFDWVKPRSSEHWGPGFDERQGAHPLHIAAYNGRKDIIQLLFDNGAKLNEPNTFNNTPLHVAVFAGLDFRGGNAQCISILLDLRADQTLSNNEGKTPLAMVMGSWYSCDEEPKVERMISTLKLLMKKAPASVSEGALNLAIQYENEPAFKHLLKEGARLDTYDKEGYLPIHHAIKYLCWCFVAELINAGVSPDAPTAKGGTSLQLLVTGCDRRSCLRPAIAERLVKKGADRYLRNSEGLSALELALKSRNEKLILALIEHPFRTDEKPTPEKYKILLNAFCMASPEVLRIFPNEYFIQLINQLEQALKESPDSLTRMIQNAAASGNEKALTHLLQLSGQYNCTDAKGRTPLHLALLNKHEQLAMMLMEMKEVDLDCLDHCQVSPLYRAVKQGCKDAVRLLLEKGVSLTDAPVIGVEIPEGIEKDKETDPRILIRGKTPLQLARSKLERMRKHIKTARYNEKTIKEEKPATQEQCRLLRNLEDMVAMLEGAEAGQSSQPSPGKASEAK
ncbi:MAG: ankyrin repeat domain-containing protein [Endozoicomonas sp.]